MTTINRMSSEPVQQPDSIWEPATEKELTVLAYSFSRSARYRGKMPDAIYVRRNFAETIYMAAQLYREPGKWERWSIQKVPCVELRLSWSEILYLLRPLLGNRTAIEVYPRDEDIINTANARWFWVVPLDRVPHQFDLSMAQASEPIHKSVSISVSKTEEQIDAGTTD